MSAAAKDASNGGLGARLVDFLSQPDPGDGFTTVTNVTGSAESDADALLVEIHVYLL
jgi:hypothetical protein